MKDFLPFTWQRLPALTECGQLRELLAAREALSEAADILPFFRQRQHLSSLIGGLFPFGSTADCLAVEYDLFGDFVCDLVVGNRPAKAFVFVEFEEAQPDALFRRLGKKALRDWSPTFEHGFSQLVDWFCKLHDTEKSDTFEARFGARSIEYSGLLVAGRDRHFEAGERRRLEWRSSQIVVNSRRIHCLTYDELLQRLFDLLGNNQSLANRHRRKS